jgi:Ribonuclease G/E
VSQGGRRLYLDAAPGEARGVVLLDGRPERLLIVRDGDAPVQQAGATCVARVRRVERGLATAFLDLGEGPDAVLPLSGPAQRISEGQALAVEIAAPARASKGPVVRMLGPASGEPRLLTPAPTLEERLQALAPGQPIEGGEDARDAADDAQEAALAVEHALGGGASLAIEPTRALTAVDVDVGGAGGGDARRGAGRVNRLALEQGARLLRLKGLGGLVVFDLAGGGQDGAALLEAAKQAFAPEMPGVAFGPVSRFGTLQLTLPWRARPVAEILNDPDGRPSARTAALQLARAIEREARTCTRVRALCAPEVAEASGAIAAALVARIGPRFDIQADPARARTDFETKPL